MSFNSLTFHLSSSLVHSFRLKTIGLASCNPCFPQWLHQNYSLDMSNTGISDRFLFDLFHNRLDGMLPNSSSVFSESPAIDLSSTLLEGRSRNSRIYSLKEKHKINPILRFKQKLYSVYAVRGMRR